MYKIGQQICLWQIKHFQQTFEHLVLYGGRVIVLQEVLVTISTVWTAEEPAWRVGQPFLRLEATDTAGTQYSACWDGWPGSGHCLHTGEWSPRRDGLGSEHRLRRPVEAAYLYNLLADHTRHVRYGIEAGRVATLVGGIPDYRPVDENGQHIVPKQEILCAQHGTYLDTSHPYCIPCVAETRHYE